MARSPSNCQKNDLCSAVNPALLQEAVVHAKRRACVGAHPFCRSFVEFAQAFEELSLQLEPAVCIGRTFAFSTREYDALRCAIDKGDLGKRRCAQAICQIHLGF